MYGSDGSRPLDYERTVLAGTDQKDSKEAEEKTLISEWRSVLKKCLTGPTLLEMSAYRCVNQAVALATLEMILFSSPL